ncbi:MAG: response regulator [Myxococcales bacterium]|nr:response regulator [Myxococcales bacterium]MCB9755440.1 response regulator [Myxococcales bacterium]
MTREPSSDPGLVLFVDDEQDLERMIRKAFRRRIRRGELKVLFANNGSEALEVLAAQPDVDVVFTDINMPIMGGLTLLGKIRALERQLRTIIVSAYSDMENIRTAMNRGAFDFLTKPIDLNDLEVTLDKTLTQVRELKSGEEARRRAADLERRNRFIRDTFGRYVSDAVVDQLLDSPEGLELGGERRRVSVLMIDLRGFTAMSERLAPETVVTLLNRYIETVVEVAIEYGGTVNSISGDGLMVIFGAPLDREDSAAQAVACGIAMQLALIGCNQRNQADGLPRIRAGVGVNTGEVVVGNIGSSRRATYTAIGVHVNIAARIESYAPGGRVLISEATRVEVEDLVTLGRTIEVRPKGLKEPLELHEVLAIGGAHELALPAGEGALRDITPVPLSYTVVRGKQESDELRAGELVRLSPDRGELRPGAALEPLSSLRLALGPGADGGDVYAKVIAVDAAQDRALLSFTSLDPVAEARIQALLEG